MKIVLSIVAALLLARFASTDEGMWQPSYADRRLIDIIIDRVWEGTISDVVLVS